MSHGMYVTCDNPACGKRIPEEEIHDWLHIQVIKSQKEATEIEGRMQGEVQAMMLTGASPAEAMAALKAGYDEVSPYNDDFCSETCVISYLTFKINEKELEAEVASDNPPAERELDKFVLTELTETGTKATPVKNIKDLWEVIKEGYKPDQDDDPDDDEGFSGVPV